MILPGQTLCREHLQREELHNRDIGVDDLPKHDPYLTRCLCAVGSRAYVLIARFHLLTWTHRSVFAGRSGHALYLPGTAGDAFVRAVDYVICHVVKGAFLQAVDSASIQWSRAYIIPEYCFIYVVCTAAGPEVTSSATWGASLSSMSLTYRSLSPSTSYDDRNRFRWRSFVGTNCMSFLMNVDDHVTNAKPFVQTSDNI